MQHLERVQVKLYRFACARKDPCTCNVSAGRAGFRTWGSRCQFTTLFRVACLRACMLRAAWSPDRLCEPEPGLFSCCAGPAYGRGCDSISTAAHSVSQPVARNRGHRENASVGKIRLTIQAKNSAYRQLQRRGRFRRELSASERLQRPQHGHPRTMLPQTPD